MKFEIKNWYTGTTIISDEAESFSALVQAAVKAGANLTRANLDGANLDGANNIPDLANAQSTIVPETGAFIGWKKCQNNVIVQLQIPADAKRSNATGRKCRASKAKVLKIFGAKEGVSQNDPTVVYKVGRVVKPTTKDPWNPNRWIECAGGIHFFITRLEAEKY